MYINSRLDFNTPISHVFSTSPPCAHTYVYLSAQFFVISELQEGNAVFHEFEATGTTYAPVGDM